MLAQGFREIITPREWQEASALLSRAKLTMPAGITSGIGFYEDGTLIGTAFLAGNLVCGICIDPDRQGEGLATSLVAKIMSHAFENGLQRLTIVTKAEEAAKFAALGFHLIASTDKAALLEYGSPNYTSWINKTRAAILNAFSDGTTPLPDNSLAAIVMNANPFTFGHRYLAETAASQYPYLVVFVVEEDASVFPFPTRLRLVSENLADLPNVLVLPAGPYMVSRASFPGYFTQKEDHASVYAGLDTLIFASRIAPDLGITARFVGSEPICQVTAEYNNSLHSTLNKHGLKLIEIERKQECSNVISASYVRELMKNPVTDEKISALRHLVPTTTLDFLLSDEGRDIAALWSERNSRH